MHSSFRNSGRPPQIADSIENQTRGMDEAGELMSYGYLLLAVLLNGNQLIPHDWHGRMDTRWHRPHAQLAASPDVGGAGPDYASSGRASKVSSRSGLTSSFQASVCQSGSAGRGQRGEGLSAAAAGRRALGFGKERVRDGSKKRRAIFVGARPPISRNEILCRSSLHVTGTSKPAAPFVAHPTVNL